MSLPAGLDISSVASLSSDPPEGCGRGQRMAQEEPLDAILSPELDKMVTDGEFEQIQSRLTGSMWETSDRFMFLFQRESSADSTRSQVRPDGLSHL